MRVFEWDEEKAAANIRKHGISFRSATRAFDDLNGIESLDTRFDYGEERYNLIAAAEEFLLAVAFTERQGRIRILSARKASRKEKAQYRHVRP
jgi:uncharacterized DUF497 family protein